MSYVQAATYSGSCGTNATWSYNTINYKLTISGSGAMTNYTSSSPAPWDSYKKSILTISIANTITSIGDYAFASCTKVPSVSMGTGLKSIGSNAFKGCSSLSRAMIPNGVTTIGDAAFYNCSNLSFVSIPEGVTSLGSQAFYGCTKLTWISIPSSVTTLGSYGLGSCSAITDIYVYWMNTSGNYIPLWPTEFVSTITRPKVTLHVPCGTRPSYMGLTGWRDFTVVEPQYTVTAQTNNSSYGTVKIDDGTAGENVSKTVNCATNVTLTAVTTTSNCNIDFLQWNDGVKDNPRTVTVDAAITYTAQFGTIGGNCGASGNNLTWSFNRCTGVLTISGSGAMKDWSAEADVPWYNYRESITSVVLPYGMTHIGDYAFRKTSITKIDLPSALQTIGKYAFSATPLIEVCIPEGVTSIGEKAFISGSEYACLTEACNALLRRVYLPSTLTELGNASIALAHLEYLTYPKSITTLGHTYYHQSKYPAKELYASWTTNVPSRTGPIATVTTPKQQMHIPYGTTAAYRAKDWARVHDLVEDVDERAIDLGLSIRWASCNIGATAPEENGNFYAWGDTLTRSSFTWGTYPYSGTTTNTMTKYCTRAANGTIDNRSTLIAFDDAAYINWGETWRMPTWAEWNELITQCTWKDTTYNNVSVWQVTGPNGNSIYLPKVGYKNNSSVTAGCYYWSSTLNTTNSNDQCNRALYINAANRSGAMYGLRYVGMPVRAVYRREWPSFTLTITDTPEGTSYTKAVNAAGTYTLTAQEDDCHRFVRWSDGNTNKTRTVTATADAVYTAEYETRHGTCGATGNEANVTWSLSCDSTLTISGTGEMADYMEGEAPWYPYREAIKYYILNGAEITNIGDAAFYNCPNLIGLLGGMPCTVKIVGKKSFMNCPQMKNFTLCFGDNTAIKDSAFYNCSNLGSFTLMGDIVHIGKRAFYNCTNLTTSELPKSITYIGEEAFYNCPNVNDLRVHWTENIPAWNNITNMDGIVLRIPCGTRALYDAADGWKDYTIIEGALAGTYGRDIRWTYNICDSTLVISGTGDMMGDVSVSSGPLGGRLKAYKDAIKTIIIEEGVTNISHAAFSQCTKLTSVTIPNSVTSIGWASFYQCKSLKSITIPNSVVNLNYNNVFEQCYALTDLYFSWTENVPKYNSTIFSSSSAPKTIHIPCGTTALYEEQGWANSLCTLEDHVISGTCGAEGDNLTWTLCTTDSTLTISGTGAMANFVADADCPWYQYRTQIYTINIDEGVTTIGAKAFVFSRISSITIPNSVTSIGRYAFCYSNYLEEIVLPEGLISIGDHAFYYGNVLKTVHIPSSVTTLGAGAFEGCELKDIYVEWQSSIPEWPTKFSEKYGVNLHIPCGTEELYSAANGWKKYTIEGEGTNTVTVQAEDPTMGDVSIVVN